MAERSLPVPGSQGDIGNGNGEQEGALHAGTDGSSVCRQRDAKRGVERRYPLVNEAQSPTRYLSDARSMFDAVRDQRRRGIETLAVYHSHPTSEPVPSRTDLEQYYGAEVMNLIISLKAEPTHVKAWWLSPNGFREADWVIVE